MAALPDLDPARRPLAIFRLKGQTWITLDGGREGPVDVPVAAPIATVYRHYGLSQPTPSVWQRLMQWTGITWILCRIGERRGAARMRAWEARSKRANPRKYKLHLKE